MMYQVFNQVEEGDAFELFGEALDYQAAVMIAMQAEDNHQVSIIKADFEDGEYLDHVDRINVNSRGWHHPELDQGFTQVTEPVIMTETKFQKTLDEHGRDVQSEFARFMRNILNRKATFYATDYVIHNNHFASLMIDNLYGLAREVEEYLGIEELDPDNMPF